MPIPRIEYTDEQIDLVIENLALSGKNLFPNLITMDVHNHVKLSAYNNIKYGSSNTTRVAATDYAHNCRDETHHEFKLTLGQIQADMRRSEEHTSELSHSGESRMPSSA